LNVLVIVRLIYLYKIVALIVAVVVTLQCNIIEANLYVIIVRCVEG